MRALKILTELILAVVLLSTACKGPDTGRSSGREIDRDEVLMIVLEDMVTNADQSAEMVRFVDLPDQSVAELRKHCGNRYIIFPITSAEHRTLTNGISPDAEEGIYLKNSRKEGVIIRVEKIRTSDKEAEAVASFSGRLNGAGFRYTLTRIKSVWRIISVRNLIAI
jgi:hypothetical protein